jgi:hypothetical protein
MNSRSTWIDGDGQEKAITFEDIVIITPYNAQVFEIAPAVVRTASLKPVRALRGPIGPQYAGFVEPLMYAALDSNLRAGRMSTVLNGEIISKARARRMVAHARAQGWLPPEAAYSQSAWSLRKNT